MKTFRYLSIIFLVIVIITSIKNHFFSEWTFVNRMYFNLFWAIHYSSFILFSFSVLAILFKSKTLKTSFIIIASFITFIIFYIQIYPIDTNKYPIDLHTLNENGNEKIIVREKYNEKSKNQVIDTVKVNDTFIFRKIIK